MSESHKNREYDHEEMSKRAISGNKFRWNDPKQREKASKDNPRNRIILQTWLDGTIIKEYRSLSEAARKVNNGKGHQNISKCANGKIPTAYGFTWKYKE